MLFIYGWNDANKPYLEKNMVMKGLNLVSSDGPHILLSQQPKGLLSNTTGHL